MTVWIRIALYIFAGWLAGVLGTDQREGRGHPHDRPIRRRLHQPRRIRSYRRPVRRLVEACQANGLENLMFGFGLLDWFKLGAGVALGASLAT